MKLLYTFTFYLLFSLFVFIDQTHAQFEGEIHFEILERQGDNSSFENRALRLTVTRNRIFVDSDMSVNVMSGLNASGILVRNDLQDFVLMTGNNEGLKVAKSEMESVVGLIDRVQGRTTTQPEPFDWGQRVSQTGRTQQIHGYTAHEFRMNGDREGDVVYVWLADQIKINWGLLQEVWYSMGKTRFENEIPVEIVMNKTSFPLLVVVTRDGNVVFRAEAKKVDVTHFDRSKTEIPSGHKLLSFTELMMNFFRQQR